MIGQLKAQIQARLRDDSERALAVLPAVARDRKHAGIRRERWLRVDAGEAVNGDGFARDAEGNLAEHAQGPALVREFRVRAKLAAVELVVGLEIIANRDRVAVQGKQSDKLRGKIDERGLSNRQSLAKVQVAKAC